jgi:hypothetical protein
MIVWQFINRIVKLSEILAVPGNTLSIPEDFPFSGQRICDPPGCCTSTTRLLGDGKRDTLIERPGIKRNFTFKGATGNSQVFEINIDFRNLLQFIYYTAYTPGPGYKATSS